MTANRHGRLALEDGTVFTGTAFGANGDGTSGGLTSGGLTSGGLTSGSLTSGGEVVFNTAMCGYTEALTDPSYRGQILVMTSPMIGNYGVNRSDVESDRIQVAGFVIRELSRITSNQGSEVDLGAWLAEAGVLGIAEIDTRALVRKLRTAGAMRGVISCDENLSDDELVELARKSPAMAGLDLASEVSVKQPGVWSDQASGVSAGTEQVIEAEGMTRYKVVAIDCGGKMNIYRSLTMVGCDVHLVPLTTPADEIRAMKPDGLFISNGPGDPAAVRQTVELLREITGEIPTFGICLGHQLLALALGAKTYKLKFGHRGANQPVRNVLTGRVEITSQNHGFAVEHDSLAAIDCDATHVHLNDQTLAGFRHRSRPIFAVQHHPEASPGPHDSAYLFDCFVLMMEHGRPVDAAMMAEAMQRCEQRMLAGV